MSWRTRSGLVAGLVAVAFATSTAFPQRTSCEARGRSAETPVAALARPPDTVEPAAPAPDLAGALAAAVQAAGNRVDLGLSVLDLKTGNVASHRGDARFYSASMSKLILAVDMLQEPLSDLDQARLTRALSISDDGAMDALWTAHDGMGAIGRVAALAGLTGTTAPDDPSQWGEVVVTADDVVRLYQHILSSPARDFVVSALTSAPGRAADGFDQRFGLLGTGAYAKQGWMYYLPSDVYLHSAGVADDRYVIALLSVDPSGSWQAARDRVNAVTSALLTPLRAS